MAFDFPASPTNGQIFTPPGGPTYVWNGSAWAGAGVTPTIGVLSTAETRSRIVNGAMQISQEYGTNAINTNVYIVDQWSAQVSGILFSASKSSATTHQIGMMVTAGKVPAAGDYLGVFQPIEGIRLWDFGYGTAGALSSVLRFEVYTNTPGTYGISVRNGATNRTFTATFTVSAVNVWTAISIIIPGDKTGTWAVDTSVGCYLGFVFASGTTQTGATGWQAGNFIAPPGITNGALTTNNIFYLRNVGLYLDPNNTGVAPPWQMPDEAQELRACQRYWEKAFGAYRTQAPAGGLVGSWAPFLVQKRAVPATSSYTNGVTGGASNPGAIATDVMGVGVQFTHAASSDAYNYGYSVVASARM